MLIRVNIVSRTSTRTNRKSTIHFHFWIYSTHTHTNTHTYFKSLKVVLSLVYSNRKQFCELIRNNNNNETEYKANKTLQSLDLCGIFLCFLFVFIYVFVSQFSARKLKGHTESTHIYHKRDSWTLVIFFTVSLSHLYACVISPTNSFE